MFALGEEAEGAGEEIQVLVGQHVSEIEALERHWLTEIEELKERQEVTFGGIWGIFMTFVRFFKDV